MDGYQIFRRILHATVHSMIFFVDELAKLHNDLNELSRDAYPAAYVSTDPDPASPPRPSSPSPLPSLPPTPRPSRPQPTASSSRRVRSRSPSPPAPAAVTSSSTPAANYFKQDP